MRSFDSLKEKEILALAISQEEEDARIYDDFAEGLKENYPAQAEKFAEMRREEDGHRHRLIELYRARFGEHIPLIRRQDVRGFVKRRPVWLVRPLGLQAVRKAAEVMELETKRFYEAAARRSADAGVRQLLGDLAEEERHHAQAAEQMAQTKVSEEESARQKRLFVLAGDPAGSGGFDGRVGLNAGAVVRSGPGDAQQRGHLPRRAGGEFRRGDQHGLCRGALGRRQFDGPGPSVGARGRVRADDHAGWTRP